MLENISFILGLRKIIDHDEASRPACGAVRWSASCSAESAQGRAASRAGIAAGTTAGAAGTKVRVAETTTNTRCTRCIGSSLHSSNQIG